MFSTPTMNHILGLNSEKVYNFCNSTGSNEPKIFSPQVYKIFHSKGGCQPETLLGSLLTGRYPYFLASELVCIQYFFRVRSV